MINHRPLPINQIDNHLFMNFKVGVKQEVRPFRSPRPRPRPTSHPNHRYPLFRWWWWWSGWSGLQWSWQSWPWSWSWWSWWWPQPGPTSHPNHRYPLFTSCDAKSGQCLIVQNLRSFSTGGQHNSMHCSFDAHAMHNVTRNVQRESNTIHSKASSELGWGKLYEKLIQVCSSESRWWWSGCFYHL